jgi:hypothetical protein
VVLPGMCTAVLSAPGIRLISSSEVGLLTSIQAFTLPPSLLCFCRLLSKHHELQEERSCCQEGQEGRTQRR